jgi:hypothetical protein
VAATSLKISGVQERGAQTNGTACFFTRLARRFRHEPSTRGVPELE